jgi:putative peptide zinc metalloprotease protein
MGIAFLVLWPYLYTDTGETWKLSDRHKQLVIASAGMAAELALAVFSTLLWALSPEGAMKSILFVFATTTWVMTLAINASPFMRFDGYFVLSDALDFPNLHERSAACAKWWLRTTYFRLPEPMPEPTLSPGNRRLLIAFAITTWVYRLVVFIGIALLVYHLFFKLLGILMFVLELWWFIALPVWRELAYVWTRRKQVTVAWRPVTVGLVLSGAAIWLVPITNEVTAPAYVRASQEHAVYAPFPALVTRIDVKPGQGVQVGATLLSLELPDLKVRHQKADVAIRSARAELARMPASEKQQERFAILETQLAEALAAKQAVDEDMQRQAVYTEYGGTVRDMAADLVEGRWVNPKQLLMRVVSQSDPLIIATVSERQIGAVKAGQKVRFYPAQSELPVVEGVVVTVEPSPVKEVSPLLLASSHGGDILVVNTGAKGPLIAQEPFFRVRIKPDTQVLQADQVLRGRVRIETDLRLVAENLVFRAISLLIREAGI